MTTVLFVSPDPAWGEPVADAIEETGYDLMWCRGPSGKDGVCAAIRGTRCPLTTSVDLAVVDTWLSSDQLGFGFKSWELVRYYERLGFPVIALLASGNARDDAPGPRTITLARRSSPDEIARAVTAAKALYCGPDYATPVQLQDSA